MFCLRNKAQAVVELALFGTLILLVTGVLISYLQRMNDQQYVQMEAFRRALEKACTYFGEENEGAGASVQYTLMQTRKHLDLSGGFYKGNSQNLSSSASVFWAVPRVAEDKDDDVEPENLIVFRINEDEKQWKYRDFVPKEHDSTDEDGDKRQRYWTFETEGPQEEGLSSETTLEFKETVHKQEQPRGFTNTKSSQLKEKLRTVIPFSIKEVDKDDDDYQKVVDSGTLWDLEQNLYRDSADRQYKYSNQAPEAEVERSRTWRTEF